MNKTVIIFLLTMGSFISSGQSHQTHHCSHQACEHGLIAINEDANTYIPPPAYFDPYGDRSAVISVSYNGFTTQAQVAFQYAVDIWASLLNSNVPILIDANFSNLGSGVLGAAGPKNLYRNFSGAPLGNTYYPPALASSLNGNDLTVGFVDIQASFNSSFNWYFGTDGNCPSGQFDFVTVVLHELCHGLGFFGSPDVNNGTGSYGFNGSPVIYDRFAEGVNGTDLISLPNNSIQVGDTLTGNSLYWNGNFGIAGNSGNRPRMYAPSNWSSGSSFSHLNESTYPSGTTNSLMTPFLMASEVIHDPGPIVLGMFQDMGWSLDPGECSITGISTGIQTACNPGSNTYLQQLVVTYENPPESGFLVVNGNNNVISSSPQTVNLTGQIADGNPVDVTVGFSADNSCTQTFVNVFTAPAPCGCLEDFNGDLEINVGDLLILLAESGCNSICQTDLNGDSVVNSADLSLFLVVYGEACN